ncbi:MAG TPA: deoxyribonuclease IV [Longimicrobiales bacterium]|nr:deoxyribonuclease IV [Longimicrobiales bacterium]
MMEPDELGAHVSAAGGVYRAPGRAAELSSVVLQLFTKQPNRWAEPEVSEEARAAFAAERALHGVRCAASHDSYLINLASPDPALFERSLASFRLELARCTRLGIEYVVTHPGNATDGDRQRGLHQNADAVARALEEVPGPVVVLLEGTAGTGNALGVSFEELAALRERVPAELRARVGICLDTCHLWAAGYDLAGDYDGVIDRLADTVGIEHLLLLHLNDSRTPLGARRDRHAHIGAGTIGEGPFRRLLEDGRLVAVPKVIETPKDGDALTHDRANLARLRAYRRAGAG